MFENGCAKAGKHSVDSCFGRFVDGAGRFKNMRVFSARCSLQNERRVGGGFRGLELRNGINVARIGNDHGHGFELLEFACLLHRLTF